MRHSSPVRTCTIKERLQVLRPEHESNYYEEFDIVPGALMKELRKGLVLVTNWHAFAPESPHAEGGKSYAVVDKGEESNEAFAKRVLGDLDGRGQILVMNDEAPPRLSARSGGRRGVDARGACRARGSHGVDGRTRSDQCRRGRSACVDVSATPFYLQGSGYAEGSPFPWLVSDFGLVDAIESGIVKIPRLPVSDTTGPTRSEVLRPWKPRHGATCEPGEKLPGGKPKPEVVYRDAEDALGNLAGQWVERFEQFTAAAAGTGAGAAGADHRVRQHGHRGTVLPERISGEDVIEVAAGVRRGRRGGRRRGAGNQAKEDQGQDVVYGQSASSSRGTSPTRDTGKPTLRIDSKLLARGRERRPGSHEEGRRGGAAEVVADTWASRGSPASTFGAW